MLTCRLMHRRLKKAVKLQHVTHCTAHVSKKPHDNAVKVMKAVQAAQLLVRVNCHMQNVIRA